MPRTKNKKRSKRLFRKILLLLLLILLLPYLFFRVTADSNAVKLYHLSEPTPPTYRNVLRVGTYNIAHARGPRQGTRNWKGGTKQQRVDRLKNIGRFLSQQNLDIVVLNEVDFDAFWSHHLNQAHIIAKAGNYPYIAVQRNMDIFTPFARLRAGNAIISRYPIDSATLMRFSPKSKPQLWFAGNHDSLIAKVRLSPNKTVNVWGIHLDYRSERVRLKAVNRILETQKKTGKDYILAGDFNSMPSRDSDKTTALTQLINSEKYKHFPAKATNRYSFTFPSQRPNRTLDWIFVPKRYQVQAARVVPANYSDHLPVVMQVRLP